MVNSTVTTASSNSQSGTDGINSADTYVFISLLLLCAVLSSILVLKDGWSDPTRNRFKLLLHVIIIITSVVPPELPMELSLAVTSAIADLVNRCSVYCTEPFRIPLAGRVDVCCFDKTGTLTSDEMVFRGVRLVVGVDTDGGGMAGNGMARIACGDGTEVGGDADLVAPPGMRATSGDEEEEADEGGGGGGGGAAVTAASAAAASGDDDDDDDDVVGPPPTKAMPVDTLRILVACHGLSTQPSARTRGMTSDVIGDPLEKAVLAGCGWDLTPNDVVVPPPGPVPSFLGSNKSSSSKHRPSSQQQLQQQHHHPSSSLSQPRSIKIRHRYAFSSKLRRMTVLATEPGTGNGLSADGGRGGGGTTTAAITWVLTKGAPETVRTLLRPGSVPPNYDAVASYHMGRGQRVLALACRRITTGGAAATATTSSSSSSSSSASSSSPSTIQSLVKKKRSDVETDLTFAGFLVLDCPLKPDSRRIIGELKESDHMTKMITGDAVLTAVEVARQVGIVGGGGGSGSGSGRHAKKRAAASAAGNGKKVVTYELRRLERRRTSGDSGDGDGGGGLATAEAEAEAEAEFAFVPLRPARTDPSSGVAADSSGGTKDNIAFVPSNFTVVRDMVAKGEIAVCVTGDVLTMIAVEAVRTALRAGSGSETGKDGGPSIDGRTVLLHPVAQTALQKFVPLISVFARHAPRQKEAVIAALNGAGHVTLMCGDGTNDVGALKMAHVGISIVSVPDLEAKQREAMRGVDKVREEERRERKKKKKKKKKKGGSKGDDRARKSSSAVVRKRKATLEESLRALAEAEEELNFVALGDASVASPFTSRTMSIKCTKDILQRGRCTLVTMLQIYKILGVNCLVNALVLTRLHMDGVKQGDRQLTALGIVVAALFFFVTKGKPVPTLSPQRPPSSVMCWQALLSICVQFGIHFTCILSITALATAHLDPEDPSLVPDGSFNPNALNTATFLLSSLATVNTFVVNYHGRPYVEDLVENQILLRSVQVCYGALFVCALEIFPPLNQLLQLAPLPSRSDVENGDIDMNSGTITGALDLKLTLCLVMVIDSLLAYKAEKAIGRLFKA